MKKIQTCIIILALNFGSYSYAIQLNYCRKNINAVITYEQRVLQGSLSAVPEGKLSSTLEQPLMCLIEIFKNSDGILRQMSHSSLSAILGRTRSSVFKFDSRYKKITEILLRESFHNNGVRKFILGGYADGMINSYSMFCDEDDRSDCVNMLPNNQLIKDQEELISASNMYLLKKAYEKVDTTQKEEIRQRIKRLHKDLGSDPGIRGLVIRELFEQMFPQINLSLHYS